MIRDSSQSISSHLQCESGHTFAFYLKLLLSSLNFSESSKMYVWVEEQIQALVFSYLFLQQSQVSIQDLICSIMEGISPFSPRQALIFLWVSLYSALEMIFDTCFQLLSKTFRQSCQNSLSIVIQVYSVLQSQDICSSRDEHFEHLESQPFHFSKLWVDRAILE